MTDQPSRGQPEPLPRLPRVDPAGVSLNPADVSPEVFAGFLVEGDEELALWALRVAMQGRSRAETYDAFVREAMRVVGQRWASARWTVSEEHLATRTLTRVMTAVAPPSTLQHRAAPVAALAGVEGEEHATGLLALEHVLREMGWETVDLGPNVPTEDLVRSCAKWQVSLVALSASLEARLDAVRDAVVALRAMPRPPLVMIGGRMLEVVDLSDIGPDWSGTSLQEAARFARRALEGLAEGTFEP